MRLTPCEQLLLDLLAIPSVSGHEGSVIDHVASLLEDDFDVHRIAVTEGRSSLLCLRGTPRVILVAHVDTVPGTVEVRVDGSLIFGRGSCDNKGSAAAMITAAREAVSQNKDGFGLLFTVGEETDFDGAIAAKAYFEKNGIAPHRIVIGEPTGLEVVTAQRGIYGIEIACTGTAEHSSTDRPDSAIHKLVALLDAFLKNGFPETTYHVGVIEGGTADNVVAARATANVMFRSMDPTIKERVATALAATNIPHAVRVMHDIAPVDHTAAPFARNAAAYFTEMAFLPNSFVLGPGSIKDAHTDAERVPRAELNEAVDRYRAFLP